MARLDQRAQLDRTRALALPPRDGAARPSVACDPPPEVFVVEGDLSARASLVWLLDSFGIGVLAYASTAEFLREAHVSRGCIIVDVEWRGVDRLVRFTEELRRRGLSLPIVATSADLFASAEEIRRAGAFAFLPKPFAGEALLDCLRQAAVQS